MKKLVGYDLGSYTFDKTAKTITLTGVPTLGLGQLLLITNVTRNIIVYNFADSTRGGSILSNVITLTYNTASMDNADKLQIFIDIPDTNLCVPAAEYISPTDFVATYTSASTLTLAGLSISISSASQIVYIKQTTTNNSALLYVAGDNGISFGYVGGIITIYKYGTAISTLVSGDIYEVGVNAQRKSYDKSTDTQKTNIQNPMWIRYTDYETIVSEQNLTASYADYGNEIDMRGYNRLGIRVTKDVNDSLNVNMKLLAKYDYAGAIEAEMPAGYTTALWTTGATDGSAYYEFDTGCVPFIQIQAIAGIVGATAGDLILTVVKFYK